jgi:DNA-binding Xre family transcriptional regulator
MLLQSAQKGLQPMSRLRLKVKEVAEAKGVSMTMLSHKSYIAVNTIRAIYRNPFRAVSTHTLQRLAAALEVPILDLIEEVPDNDTQE